MTCNLVSLFHVAKIDSIQFLSARSLIIVGIYQANLLCMIKNPLIVEEPVTINDLGKMICNLENNLIERMNRLNSGLEDRLSNRINKLEQRMDKKFDEIDSRFDNIDERFKDMDKRFDQVDHRLAGLSGQISEVSLDYTPIKEHKLLKTRVHRIERLVQA